MALISCISCGARISDKAVACPKCGWTNQSEAPIANAEELRIKEELKAEEKREAEEKLKAEEERKAELIRKREYYLGLEANKVNKKEENKIGFFQVLIPVVIFLITGLAIFSSLDESTFVKCGEKYWNSDRGRWVKKRC